MPFESKDLVEFTRSMGYEVKTRATGRSVVDELLGASEGGDSKETMSKVSKEAERADMVNTSVFFDTDILINRLAKEVIQTPVKNSGERLTESHRKSKRCRWRASDTFLTARAPTLRDIPREFVVFMLHVVGGAPKNFQKALTSRGTKRNRPHS